MTRLASLALVLALAAPSLAAAQEADLAGEQAMLAQINALRAEHQLAAVERLGELDAVARAHTEEMARNGALAHVSSTSGTPEDRVRAAGIPSGVVTENVAMHADAAQAHQALLGSAPHQGNMLSPTVTHVGISAIQADNAVYITQLFAERPAPAPAVAEAPAAVLPSIDAPVEAAAEAAQAAAPVFGLIPPFVERALGTEAPADATAEAAPTPPAAEEPVLAAPPVEATPAIAAPAPAAAEPAPEAPAAAAAPATSSNALQQLVGIGQALLRAVTTQPAAQ